MKIRLLSKKQLQYIEDLKNRIYCRIKPSKTHGVGVFAIRPIPIGTDIFSTGLPAKNSKQWLSIPTKHIFENSKIHEGVLEMIHDFMTVHNDAVDFPAFSLNELNISFYLNHSDTPNVVTRDGEIFVAARDIESGEELLSNYQTYSEGPVTYK